MSFLNYSLLNDFPLGLDNQKLYELIKNVIVSVDSVVTTGDEVYVYFDTIIDENDEIAADLIVANYVYEEPSRVKYLRASKIGCTFEAGIAKSPGTWLKNKNYLSGFNETTGAFTCPFTGVYTINVNCILNSGLNTGMDIAFKKGSNVAKAARVQAFGNPQRCSDGFTEYLAKGDIILLEGIFSANESCDLELFICCLK